MIKIDIKNFYLDISTSIQRGSFVALTGKSGSGKTTLLRTLAGLQKDSTGSIIVDDEIWLDDKTSLPPQKRNIGFVFQDYALFENMSVIENLLFVNDDKDLANHLLDIIELQEFKDKYPSTLSGGQKQRVALARAMMNKPKLLLMDEPLSSLDKDMRIKLQDEIEILHNEFSKEFNTTTIMVSHNLDEIYRLGHRIITLENGKIIHDESLDSLISANASLSLDAVVIKLIDNGFDFTLLLSIETKIIKINISNEEAQTIQIGQNIKLSDFKVGIS